jgi:hypothetical protein
VGYASSCISSGANSPVDDGGQPYGEPSLGRWLVGSGGGAGGSDEHSNDSGSGGRGAGLIAVFARTILLDGSVSASGATGTVPQDFQLPLAPHPPVLPLAPYPPALPLAPEPQ